MKWNHTTESPVVDAWLAQGAGRFGGRVQGLVNETLLAAAEGRLADPAPLLARIAELERHNAQLVALLQQSLAARPPSPAPDPAPPAGRGLTFTR